MLNYDELLNVLKVEGVAIETFEIKFVRELYGTNINDDKILELIDNMIFVAVNMDTPLYDILEFITTLENDNKIDENYSCAGIIMDNIIDSLVVSNANCERLLNLITDADIVSAYNTIITIYSSTIPAELLRILTERATKLFDPELLMI